MRWYFAFRTRRRARKTLHGLVLRYGKLGKRDPSFEQLLLKLDVALREKRTDDADQLAHLALQHAEHLMPHPKWLAIAEWLVGLAFALFIALLVRQTWFELYTIPTGSMRPTIKEGDAVIVSKTAYALNVPFRPESVLFRPDLLKRTEVVVFTGENLPISDSKMSYFWIVPGYKQYVKRLIGKPGDTLYFYGGKIYGIDKDGNPLSELLDAPWMASLEHIPFIHFEDEVQTPHLPTRGVYTTATLFQMNEPLAKLTLTPQGQIRGELLGSFASFPSYGSIWGMDNFATSRILPASEVPPQRNCAPFYLELTHHPSFSGAHLIRDERGRLRPSLGYSVSYIPLCQDHIDRIASVMTTARFEVNNGQAARINTHGRVPLANVPDGIYEIVQGVGYEIHAGNVATELSPSHPLLQHTPELVVLLYNQGIEWNGGRFPSRYAYFRDGSLYLMGAPIFCPDDPTLIAFNNSELAKQTASSKLVPYKPFLDSGPPSVETIRTLGLTIPDQKTLVLGDNHSMSADSRRFGFVPYSNLRGSPSLLFWPPGPRCGRLPQPTLTFWTPGQIVLLSVLALLLFVWRIQYRRRWGKPLTF